MSYTPTRCGVLVVATEPVLRNGIAAVIEYPFVVLDSVGTLRGAERALAHLRSRLCVFAADPPLPGTAHDEACATLLAGYPGTMFVVLVRQPVPVRVRLLCRLGARGVFDTSVSPDQLRTALIQLSTGQLEMAIQPTLVRWLLDDLTGEGYEEGGRPPDHGGLSPLTSVQTEVLRCLAEGYTSKDITEILDKSPSAVSHIIERAVARLGATSRAHATVLALRRGLLNLGVESDAKPISSGTSGDPNAGSPEVPIQVQGDFPHR